LVLRQRKTFNLILSKVIVLFYGIFHWHCYSVYASLHVSLFGRFQINNYGVLYFKCYIHESAWPNYIYTVFSITSIKYLVLHIETESIIYHLCGHMHASLPDQLIFFYNMVASISFVFWGRITTEFTSIAIFYTI
jgi:hypothetical protein